MGELTVIRLGRRRFRLSEIEKRCGRGKRTYAIRLEGEDGKENETMSSEQTGR